MQLQVVHHSGDGPVRGVPLGKGEYQAERRIEKQQPRRLC